MFWRYEVTGVDTITLHFGDAIDIALTERIQRAARALSRRLGPRLIDLVPSYTTLLLRYNLLEDDLASLVADITDALATLPEVETNAAKGDVVEIPVYYDPSTGPDLDAVAARAGLSREQ